MFDSRLRPLIDPPLNRAAGWIAATGLSANALTMAGLVLGALATLSILAGFFLLALMFIGLNRLADGLDGPLARVSQPTELGGYYDIVFDFLFYGAVPLAFAFYDPNANALAAAFLLASFYANGATFLAFSALAAKTGRSSDAQGQKSIYYFAGLAEGAETIAAFVLMCLLPEWFALIAAAFALMCFISAGARIFMVTALLSANRASELPATKLEGADPSP